MFDTVDHQEFLRLQKRLGLSHKHKQVNTTELIEIIYFKKIFDTRYLYQGVRENQNCNKM